MVDDLADDLEIIHQAVRRKAHTNGTEEQANRSDAVEAPTAAHSEQGCDQACEPDERIGHQRDHEDLARASRDLDDPRLVQEQHHGKRNECPNDRLLDDSGVVTRYRLLIVKVRDSTEENSLDKSICQYKDRVDLLDEDVGKA